MSEIDGFTAFAIFVRALGYAGGLVAIGSGLFLAAFGRQPFPLSDPSSILRTMRQTAWIGVFAAATALVAAALGVGVRAGRLSGMDALGMTDPMMLQIVWEGPVGTAVIVRLIGLAAVVAGLVSVMSPVGRILVLAGATAFGYSHSFAGHAAEAPAWVAGALTAHLVAAGFWVGAFAPLAMITRRAAAPDAARILDAFGRGAVFVVATLVVAGAAFAVVLVRSPGGLFGTPYGLILLAKIGLVGALLGLAALNKLRLVPAMAAGDAAARRSLLRSIRLEAVAAAAILVATAVLTSVAMPPARDAAAVIS